MLGDFEFSNPTKLYFGKESLQYLNEKLSKYGTNIMLVYISEGLLHSLIHSARIAIQNPNDYEAGSNIMWIATWALNTLIAQGKTTDWMVHMIGQSVGAYTDATPGMTLLAVSMAYYRHIYTYGLEKFR